MNKMKKYKKLDLQNGTKLYYIKNNISKSTMVDVVFASGSRCDTIPGLAHFTEHMFFTGTKNNDKKAITKKYFEFIGVNACTNNSYIYFTGNLFSKELKDYLTTVGEMVTESTFSEKAVKDESKVISQEIAVYKDNYQLNAYFFNDYNLSKNDVYKYANLGTNETISTIKSKDVKNFVKKYFVKENMEVYVSSPKPISAVKKIVESTLMKTIPSNQKFKQMPLFRFEVSDDSFYEIKTEQIGKDYLFINFVFKNDFNDFKRRKQIELLLELLNNHSEGIMNDLRWGDDKNLTYSGRFYVTHGKTESIITFTTQCDKQNLNPIIETVANYITKVKNTGFKQDILEFEKREYKYDDDVKEPRLRREFCKLFDYRTFGVIRDEKVMRKYIENTTLAECENLFHEIFDVPRVSLSVYGDATKKDVISKAKFLKLFK